MFPLHAAVPCYGLILYGLLWEEGGTSPLFLPVSHPVLSRHCEHVLLVDDPGDYGLPALP